MKNIKFLIGIIIGFILAIGIGNAYNLNANLVTYDKKNTTLESEDVQGAIDELGLLANTLTDTSDATASASDILSGKTAYVSGEKITGTYEEKGEPTIYTNTKTWSGSTDQITITEKCNIGVGKTILGVYFNGNNLGFSSNCEWGPVTPNFSLNYSYDSTTGYVTINFYFIIWTNGNSAKASSISLPYVIIYY